jgi:4-amino-4-deoxy-L-arabinose transferase-like glycosyltransferase
VRVYFRVAVLLIVLAISAGYCLLFFHGYLGLSDGNDYAGLARSLIRGQGFSLGHLYPLAFAFGEGIPRPDNMWAPAYPVYLAFWFLIFGANDTAVLIGTIAAIWLLIMAAYLLCRKLMGEDWGILAAALIGLNQSVLKVALEGSPEMLTGALLGLSLLPLLGKTKYRNLIVSGFLFGLTVLCRYQLIALAIPLIILLVGRNLKSVAVWFSIVVLTILPWLVRNAMVFGDPFFTLQNYGEFTKGMGHLKYYYYTYRSFTPMTIWYAMGNLPFYMLKKFAAGIFFFGLNTPIILNFAGVIPLLYGLKKAFMSIDLEKKFILVTVASMILVVLLSSLDGQHWRHLVNLQVLFVVSILVGLRMMFSKFQILRDRYAQAAAVVLLLFPARFPAQEFRLIETADRVQGNKLAYEAVAEVSNPGDVVISDASDGVWWYADRASIWIPVVYSDLVKLMEIQPSEYIYLEKPSEYLSRMSSVELADFQTRVEWINGVEDGWALYRVKGVAESAPQGAGESPS